MSLITEVFRVPPKGEYVKIEWKATMFIWRKLHDMAVEEGWQP